VHRDIHHDPHPDALNPFIPELDDFNKHNHYNILFPILRSAHTVSFFYKKLFVLKFLNAVYASRLLALGLEIPEETFVEQNKFEDEGFSSSACYAFPPFVC
jgi:hypothetical protein